MIRIRELNGDVTELNGDNVFIELCDADGKIAMVFYEHQGNGEIYQLDHTSKEESENYENVHKVEFIKDRKPLPKHLWPQKT